MWAKAGCYISAIWDELIALVDNGIQSGALHSVDTAVLRVMLEQTVKKLLDYDFTAKSQISFESGMKAMYDIVLYGLLDQHVRAAALEENHLAPITGNAT